MGTARGGSVDGAATAMIRLEQVRISDTQADNAIRLPLSTCMYLGDRWECLFHRPNSREGGLRAYSPHRLQPGAILETLHDRPPRRRASQAPTIVLQMLHFQ